MSAVLAIARKDLRLLLRDRAALFWALVFPLAFSLLFGAILRTGLDQGPKDVPVALVVDAQTPRAERVGEALRRSGAVALVTREADAGRRDVRRGDAAAFVRVPAGDAPVEIGSDPTRRAEVALVTAIVSASLSDVPTPVVATTVAAEGGPRTGYEIVFPVAVLWGLIGCAGSFAVAMVAERTRGTHLRLLAAPLSLTELIGGKALACFFACAVDALLLSLVAWSGLGVRIESVGALMISVVASATCFVGITVLLSVMGKSEQSVGGAGWATLLLLAMMGGAMVPLSLMPSWLRALSHGSPVKWGVVALEGATWRGATAGELVVPVAILFAVGIACFGLGLLRARRMHP